MLHELVHGVLRLQDAVDDTTRLGECDEHINRVRRELGLPERQRYSPRLIVIRATASTNVMAELLFVRAGGASNRAKAERFYVQWEVAKVSVGASAACRKKSAAVFAAR